MTRFEILEKEINNSRKIKESDRGKGRELIYGWSPNNVRRLVIGFDYCIVQFHTPVSGRIIKVVDFKGKMRLDFDTVLNEPSKYKSILNVLTADRVCSCIEEIVFCTQNYPNNVLILDTDLNALVTNSSRDIRMRFPRLSNISLVDKGVESLMPFVKESSACTTLLYDVLNKSGFVDLDKSHEFNIVTWWDSNKNSMMLRPNFYNLDIELSELFAKTRDIFKKEEKDKAILESKMSSLKKVVDSNYAGIKIVCDELLKCIQLGDSIYTNATVVDKGQWAKHISNKGYQKALSDKFIIDSDLRERFKALDFKSMLSIMASLGKDCGSITYVLDFIGAGLGLVMGGEKQDFDGLKKLLLKVLTIINSHIYFTLVKFSLKTAPKEKYMRSILTKLDGMEEIKYTRVIVEYCNDLVPDFVSKTCFDLLSFSEEILVKDYDMHCLISMNNKILCGLKGYVSKTSTKA